MERRAPPLRSSVAAPRRRIMKKSRRSVFASKGYYRGVSHVLTGGKAWLSRLFPRSVVPRAGAASGFLTERDLRARLAPDALIAGMIPARGIVTLYGEPGDGKTFVGLACGLSIATGQVYLGRGVRQGAVV